MRAIYLALILVSSAHAELFDIDTICDKGTTTTLFGATTTTAVTTTTIPGFVQDGFERSSLGSNWSPISTTPNCLISGSSDLDSTQDNSTPATCFYNAFTPTTTSYACALVNVHEGDSFICLGADAISGGHGACCEFFQDPADHSSDYWVTSKVDGTSADPASCGGGTSLGFGTPFYIGIERTGASTYRCLHSTTGTSWTALTDECTLSTSFTYVAGSDPGRTGAGFFNLPSQVNTTIEKWEGGNGALPTGHVCGG